MKNVCFRSIRQDVAKQTGFVSDLCNYSSQQWVEFFRVKASTAQALVEEIGPFFRKRDGILEVFGFSSVCLHLCL